MVFGCNQINKIVWPLSHPEQDKAEKLGDPKLCYQVMKTLLRLYFTCHLRAKQQLKGQWCPAAMDRAQRQREGLLHCSWAPHPVLDVLSRGVPIAIKETGVIPGRFTQLFCISAHTGCSHHSQMFPSGFPYLCKLTWPEQCSPKE